MPFAATLVPPHLHGGLVVVAAGWPAARRRATVFVVYTFWQTFDFMVILVE